VYAIKLNQTEQELRKKYNVNYDPNEIEFKGRTLTMLLLLGFVGGWVAGALGLGGGSIYNPALLSLGVHAQVAGATGMYLVLFSTVNSCVINSVNNMLDYQYGGWLGFWSVVGSCVGIIVTEKLVR